MGFIPELVVFVPIRLRNQIWDKYHFLNYIYNTRSSPMSSLFLTVLSPTLLCERLLVLIFRSTARCHTHASELSA
jgi:hypothetical protein